MHVVCLLAWSACVLGYVTTQVKSALLCQPSVQTHSNTVVAYAWQPFGWNLKSRSACTPWYLTHKLCFDGGLPLPMQEFETLGERPAASATETVRLCTFAMRRVPHRSTLCRRLLRLALQPAQRFWTCLHAQRLYGHGPEDQEADLLRASMLWPHHPDGAQPEPSFSVMVSFPGFDPRQVTRHNSLNLSDDCAAQCSLASVFIALLKMQRCSVWAAGSPG